MDSEMNVELGWENMLDQLGQEVFLSLPAF